MAKKYFIGDTELAQKSAVDSALLEKQDALVSGSNIKTINNESVLGAGNINIESGLTEVTASDIDSESATSGQVLMADGDGGASWQTPSGADVEGTDIKSTGENANEVIISNGSGGASWDTIKAGYVDSQSATSGQVLTADGTGGASWQSVQSGSSNYNDLSNKPITNQDIDAVGFTPVANTYYRHTGVSSATYTIGGIYYYDGTSFALLNGQSGGGSTDVIIDLGNKFVSGATDVISNLTAQQKTQILDTSVDNVYIKFNDINGDNGNVILKRQRIKIGDPLNMGITEVYFISADAQEDYGQSGYEISTNKRYIFWYIYDYSMSSERAYIQRVTLGKLDSIYYSISGLATNCGDTLPLDEYSFYEDGVSGNIRVKFTGKVLSGTYQDGDTISNSEFLYCAKNQYELQINGKRFLYQKEEFDGVTLQTTATYLSSELDNTLIKLTIMRLNTTTGLVNFTEQVVNDGMTYTTTAPSAPNTNGLMKLVVLSSDPATKYAGWLYYITQ